MSTENFEVPFRAEREPDTSGEAPLVLASSSIYRRELLARLRIPFTVITPDVDETPLEGEPPEKTALRLAREKAEAVARHPSRALIIGSDQVATLDGAQIGKPGNHDRAIAQLRHMRGRQVVFHTALCLLDARAPSSRAQIRNVQTIVTFRDLPDAVLDAYLRLEKPYDCAGSAKNEGLGITLIKSIESTDPTALTGLPLIALCDMLEAVGVNPVALAR